MASGKRIPFINVLRLLAMVFVLTPHLLAYQLANQVMIWVGTYVLNPLHIVQYCGALGVSLFYITSGPCPRRARAAAYSGCTGRCCP